ncbi:MAG: hypothetical protein GX639_20320 [Fibrobacter sp.]|nr:hypothetical protein [Fibrobacter sp.]
MKLGLVVTCVALVFALGCQSKQKCLEKYHFSSCEEFQEVFSKTKDNDEALKLHSISIECGCKTE